ncbi:hypothetical protein QUA44_14715 [Microcoleus sp. N9_A2]|uniref:hypothetical protein n=1 Tax=unclassified Microcoleus TaxID=2642155 RepID=UPI002FD6883D
MSEVNDCCIPGNGSPEAVNREVRQQYRLLLKPRFQDLSDRILSPDRVECSAVDKIEPLYL